MGGWNFRKVTFLFLVQKCPSREQKALASAAWCRHQALQSVAQRQACPLYQVRTEGTTASTCALGQPGTLFVTLLVICLCVRIITIVITRKWLNSENHFLSQGRCGFRVQEHPTCLQRVSKCFCQTTKIMLWEPVVLTLRFSSLFFFVCINASIYSIYLLYIKCNTVY